MTPPPNSPNQPDSFGLSTLMSRRRLFALAGGAAILAACSDGTEPPTAVSAVDASTTTDATTTTVARTTTTTLPATTTTTLPPPVQPLTGLPLTDPALLNRVALVVKISNDKGARPQTGLNEADIVYECWGAGPTRFAAVYHSRDRDFVGPIRSCREQDVNLVGSFNRAVFACSGGNPGNINLLRNSDLLLITEGKGPGWELDPKKSRPHKTHADTAQLRTNAPDRVGPEQQFEYRAADAEPDAGEAMAGFDLQMQQVFVQWRFDPVSGSYLRAHDGKPHMMEDGVQVSTENVVIAWLDYEPSSTDRRSPDGTTTGTNSAVVFTGGKMITGTWTRADRLLPFTLADDTGEPILLKPGRTFFEMANGGNGSFGGNADTFTAIP
jgi:Protein of unknown function (DUF3048) N-terminal domain/Protein of unknown function (DUF3048) C-terminal domain